MENTCLGTRITCRAVGEDSTVRSDNDFPGLKESEGVMLPKVWMLNTDQLPMTIHVLLSETEFLCLQLQHHLDQKVNHCGGDSGGGCGTHLSLYEFVAQVVDFHCL